MHEEEQWIDFSKAFSHDFFFVSTLIIVLNKANLEHEIS